MSYIGTLFHRFIYVEVFSFTKFLRNEDTS